MSERQLLDLLAKDAPVAGPDLADNVIRRARDSRRNRWSIGGACAAVVMIAAVPLVVNLNRYSPTDRTGSPGASSRPTPAPPSASEVAPAYAAAIRYLAQQLDPGKHWRVLFVLDHTCEIGASPTGPCDSQPISAQAQRDLAAALQSYAPVRFVSDRAKIRDKNLTVIDDGLAVTVGTLHLSATAGRVAVAVQCGGLCGLGQTLVLAKERGIWTVTGQTGVSWIS